MLRSMTGYARLSADTPLGHVAIELQSVNRRFLDIQTFLPTGWGICDSQLRRWLSDALSRGQVIARISVACNGNQPLKMSVNKPLLHALHSAWAEIAKEIGAPYADAQCLSLYQAAPDLMVSEEVAQVSDIASLIQPYFLQVLEQLLLVKAREGQILQTEIRQRLQAIRDEVIKITGRAPAVVEKYREKIRLQLACLETMASLTLADRERLFADTCRVIAEQLDISEELSRLASHLDHADSYLEKPDASCGKALEFILQELQREVNTIGSKGSDAGITQSVVTAKLEIERIREQVQNVE